MLNNKFLIIISVIAVSAVIFLSIKLEEKSRKLPPVINAIPPDVSFFIETDDINYLLNKISKNEDLKETLAGNLFTEKFFENILFADSLIHDNKKIKKFFSEKNVILSAHPQGHGKSAFLFATGAQNNNENKELIKTILKEINPHAKIKKTEFAGAEILSETSKKNKHLVFTFYKDYMLLSFSEILIQKSIKTINSGIGLQKNPAFENLYEKTENRGDAEIFLNYERFFSNTGNNFNNSFKKTLKLLQNTAYWSAFDISLKRKHLKLTGHTILKPEMQFLSVFKNTNPEKSDVLGIMPEKTAFFLSFNIKNGNEFKYKYEDFLARIKNLNNFQIQLAEFYKKFKIKEDETDLYAVTSDEIALIWEDINKNGKNQREYVFIKYKNKTKAEDFFDNIITKYAEKEKIEKNNLIQIFNTEEDNYKIIKLPVKNIPEIFYGEVFKNNNLGYCTLLDDFMVFGNNTGDIKDLIYNYEKDKTFKRKSPNYRFLKSLPDESNIFLYADIFHSAKKIKQTLKEKTIKKFDKSLSSLKRIQGPAIQFIFDAYPIYTTVDIGLNSVNREISETVWEVRLDTLIATKPYIVINHNTDEKEIVIQDAANKLYLIDKNGKILWTRQLDGKIISDIYQIDYYENNKLQLLFNTENKIYCIDRKGNWLEGYPVKLKSKAVNGIALFDYDQNRNYRIFVACANKNVYLFDKNGEIIPGWKFDKTETNVTQKIRHFKNNDKDYIVFRDKNKLYILNRKGMVRVSPEVNIPLSENTEIYFAEDNAADKAHFCVSNPAGTVYYIYENGKVKKTELKTYTRNHFFVYEDITGDNIPEYIFTDKNQTDVFDGKNKKRLYSYSYDEKINGNISVYKFGDKDIRTGASASGKIYLINNKGKLCKGFPLAGTGLFSITVFDRNPRFSLIVGNKDNYLYKYYIK
ncbi:MAG: hypothetical protein GXO50_03520 [Chlorobi bacterium]|nr:hypothetical protein [Chlorobiota bacterium]